VPPEAEADRIRRLERLVLLTAVVLPLCVGITVASRWHGEAGENFYTTISQVIATLFVAIAVEFFTSADKEREGYEVGVLIALVLLAWTGFFACIRALVGDDTGTSLTAGVAACGLTANVVLVSLTLYMRIVQSRQARALNQGVLWLFVGFLTAPVLVLILA